jgi:hypothetical protein
VVLLTPRFGLGLDGEHSGERAASCGPPVFAAAGGKTSRRVYKQLTEFRVWASRDVGQRELCVQRYRVVGRLEVLYQ